MKHIRSFLLTVTMLLLLFTSAMAQSGESHTLEPLHVDGRYLKNPKGDIVTLHGWITDWQNMHQEFYQGTVDYEAHFKAWKLTTDSILSKGWKVDYARLHFGGNNPRDFDGFVQRGDFEKTTLRMIDYLNSKGIYVLLMADVESGDFAEHPQRFVGDPWYQRLLRYWDYVSSHPRIKNNPGVMFELQNEPGNFISSDGKLNDFRTLRAYYQSMVDLIRRNGCQQVIWVPGWHCQIYYAGYATFPVEGDNIGYAAHFYDWGWVDGEEVKRVWRELKAASNMAPVIITETYWDGQYGPFMGGTASGFGASLKRELDEAGNVSWNLLSEGHPMASVGDSSFGPAIHNDPEGTYVACHKWFEEYAKTKYTPIKSLVATQIELEEVHKTVYPGDVRPITLMASFQDGRRWNVAGDTEWTSSNESVLTVIKGNIHVKGEGKVTVSGTYTDGMGQVFKTQFDVTSSLFPLTADGIVIHNGGYDEITHTFLGGFYLWDYGGDVLLFVGSTYQNTPALNWNQRGGLDFSAYKYLVVRMNNQTSFGTIELYDQLATTYDGTAKVYEQIDGRNEVVIDLHGYPNFDPSHVTSVGIGYGPVSIKEIFLSNDGVNPAAPYTMPTLVTADDMTMYYGDVPQLTYSVSGYGNVGTPKLTTTATSTSPVGTYDILIEGNAEGVTYKPGKLTVLPAPLTITADDIVMNPGTDVPELTLTYDGLKGGETAETALSELPTAVTTATKDSSCGNYSITVSGGSAANYELAWHPGTLTIAPAAGSSVPVTDYTSRVKTDTESWQAWGECSTDFAPAVTTADGRTAPMVERYEETVGTVGRIMEQTVSGLEDGEYTVVLCANANYTDGRGFASDLQDGARDVVELYANDERQPMTAHIGTAVGNNGEYTFNSVRVTDGTLTIGMEAIKPGTNWHTLQIKQLALNKVYTLAESYAVALAEAEELLTQKMADAARGTLQETMGLEQSYANYYRLTEAIAQAKSSIEAMEYARIALDVTRDELLTATNVCTPQAKSDYLYYYNAACRAYDEDWLTDYKATEIYNPYKGGGAGSYWHLVTYMMSAWEYNMGNTSYMGGAPYNVSWCDPMEAPDKMGFNKPFIEYFLAEGNTTLEARTLKATMTDMEPGLYTVTVRVRLRVADNENGKPEGVTLQVCDGAEVPLCGQRIDDSKDYQDSYTATGIVGDDGVLTIMFHVASDNNLCWMAFRDLWQDKGETSIVSADNLTMVYGDEVPQLTCSVVGEELGGEPQLTTTATSMSPVGTYPIEIAKGSVTRHAVEYVAGTLTVTKAPLTVTAKSYTIEQGDPLPNFEVEYAGFKNKETSDVLAKKPVASCAATSWSEPGEYEIILSNAVAENYEISYTKGVLTIAPHVVDIPDGNYYMKNVASGKFLVGANDWGTRASLGEHGVEVTLYNVDNGKFLIDTHIANSETNHYLGSDGYVDAEAAEWIITEPTEGVYTLSIDGINYWGYDGVSTILTGTLTDATQPNAQWQLVTRAEMEAALANATESNPVDATFYIQAADFNRNDSNVSAWKGEPVTGGWDSNKNAERWNTAPMDVYQELAGLPNGYYRLSVQGYYRIGNDANDAALAAEQYTAGTPELNAYLYGNDAVTPLMSIMADAKSGEAPEGNYCTTPIGYVPQSMDGASAFFSEGLYHNELVVKVTDETLRIGIKKEVASYQDWVIFDNFELYYLGTNYTSKPISVTSIILNEKTVILEEGETLQLTAYAVPYNADNRSVTWSSSNEASITVDANGMVTAVKGGSTAIITAKANDGSGVTATCRVVCKVDGIEGVEAEAVQWPTDIYDVTGRLVKKAASSAEGLQKGIYLIRGRKVIIK